MEQQAAVSIDFVCTAAGQGDWPFPDDLPGFASLAVVAWDRLDRDRHPNIHDVLGASLGGRCPNDFDLFSSRWEVLNGVGAEGVGVKFPTFQ